MSSFRFIHTGDLHLDSPFRGLTNIPSKLHQLVEKSTFSAFEKIVDYCISENVDFLLIAGDVYDVENVSVRTQLNFYKYLKLLTEHGISTYIIHGNHDPMDFAKLDIDWPDKVHIFSSKEVESIPHIIEEQEVARIFGRSYPTKVFMENIVEQYKPITMQRHKNFNIGLLHTNLDGDPSHDPYAPTTIRELKNSDMDYWALGHIHKAQIYSRTDPAIVYPGNPQGRHIKETGQKGCTLVDVVDKRIESIKFLPTSSIIWETIEIDITNSIKLEDIIEEIQTTIDNLQKNIQISIIIRIVLKGKTELNIINQTEIIEDITAVVNDTYSNLTPWVWVESINVQTKPNISIEDLLTQNTFVADLLNELEQQINNENKDILNEIGKDLFRHRGLKKHLNILNESELNDVYDKVRHLVIDYLMGEES